MVLSDFFYLHMIRQLADNPGGSIEDSRMSGLWFKSTLLRSLCSLFFSFPN